MADVPQEFVILTLGATRRSGGRMRVPLGAWAGALLLGLLGCGYRPVYGPAAAHYAVVAGGPKTSSFEAAHEVAAGVRSELGAADALGDAFPRVVVEVLRVDERSIGVQKVGEAVLARGSEIVVVGRAQVFEHQDGPASLDTGDFSRAAQFASGTTPAGDAAARSRAIRDASRSLGKALGRAVLGLPEPAEG